MGKAAAGGAKAGAIGAKAGAAGAKAGAAGAKSKLGAMAKDIGKDFALDAGASLASSAASLPGKAVSGIGNTVKQSVKSTVKDEPTPTQTESYRNHSFAASYEEVLRLQEAKMRSREEVRAKLAAHDKAMKDGKGGESPYFGKKESDTDNSPKKQSGLKPVHGDGSEMKKGEEWKRHQPKSKMGLQKGGKVGEFPMTPDDKKINARIDKYMDK